MRVLAMKVKEIMTANVIAVSAKESVDVAARTLAQYNVGALPVCTMSGKLCGMVTDRDLVTRCLASGMQPSQTKVSQVMTPGVVSVDGDMDVSVAAHLMGRKQIRRLAVTENGRLCGIISLGDLAIREDCAIDAADALGDIARNITDG
jgi:CBS domain-containing protein